MLPVTIQVKDKDTGLSVYAEDNIKKGSIILEETTEYYSIIPEAETGISINCPVGVIANKIRSSRSVDYRAYTRFDTNNLRCPSGCKENMEIHSMVQRNAFNVYGLIDKKLKSIAFFKYASRLNHSCTPNAEYIIYQNVIRLFALKDLKEGDEVCISYVDPMALTLQGRYSQVLHVCNFHCLCPDCKEFKKDPVMNEEFNRLENHITDMDDIETQISTFIGNHEKEIDYSSYAAAMKQYAFRYEKLRESAEKYITQDTSNDLILKALLDVCKYDTESYWNIVYAFRQRFVQIYKDKESNQEGCYIFFEDACCKALRDSHKQNFITLATDLGIVYRQEKYRFGIKRELRFDLIALCVQMLKSQDTDMDCNRVKAIHINLSSLYELIDSEFHLYYGKNAQNVLLQECKQSKLLLECIEKAKNIYEFVKRNAK